MRLSHFAAATTAAAICVLAGVLLVPVTAQAATGAADPAPTITIGLSPATLDYGHQVITVSGAVTAAANTPVVGADVGISYLNGAGQNAQLTVATDGSGDYSGNIIDPAPTDQVITATVAATSTTAAASASASLGFTQDQVTISASLAQTDVNENATDLLSGVARYVSAGTAYPLGGTTLTITWLDYPFGQSSAAVTTAADGTFSYVLPGFGAQIDQTVTVSSASTAYLIAAETSLSAVVNQMPQVANFAGTLSASHVLSFDACGGIGQVLANAPLFANLVYQYSMTPHGPWKMLGESREVDFGSCYLGNNTTGDANYPAQFKAPLANGYYRAYAPAVPMQMAAASQPIHLWKYVTRITNFKINPRKVRRNGVITVSGRFWELTSRWTAIRNAKITIEYRYKGKTYVVTTRLTTNRSGVFSGRFRVPRSASWLAVFPGSKTQFVSATAPMAVTVR